MKSHLKALLLSSLALGACSEKTPQDKASDSTAAVSRETEELSRIPSPDTSGTGRWTANTRASHRDVPDAALLKNIRTASSADYDRIVFDFAGTTLPNWHIAYTDKPSHSCGSGEAIDVAGKALMEIKFTPANAHDTSGHMSLAWKEKQFHNKNLLEMKVSCDFEAVTTLIAGLKNIGEYRVLELQDPARLVIDIKN